MGKFRKHAFFCSFFAIVSLASEAFSQEAGLPAIKAGKNTIAITTSLRHFFDGAPMIETRHIGKRAWLKLAGGIEYSRQINDRHGWMCSLSYLRFGYHRDTFYPVAEGDVLNRWMWYLGPAYKYTFASNAKTELSGTLGFSLRYGVEEKLRYYWHYETIYTGYTLADLGLSAGVRMRRTIYKRFDWAAEADFTRYLLFHKDTRYSPHSDYPYRPSRNLLTLQMGLGYRF